MHTHDATSKTDKDHSHGAKFDDDNIIQFVPKYWKPSEFIEDDLINFNCIGFVIASLYLGMYVHVIIRKRKMDNANKVKEEELKNSKGSMW